MTLVRYPKAPMADAAFSRISHETVRATTATPLISVRTW